MPLPPTGRVGAGLKVEERVDEGSDLPQAQVPDRSLLGSRNSPHAPVQQTNVQGCPIIVATFLSSQNAHLRALFGGFSAHDYRALFVAITAAFQSSIPDGPRS